MARLSPFIQAKLCEALMTLLQDEAPQNCLPNFAHCLFLLDLYKEEIPRLLLNELHGIMDDYVETGDEGQIIFRYDEFTGEQQTDLSERLLSIYIEIRGGNLIF